MTKKTALGSLLLALLIPGAAAIQATSAQAAVVPGGKVTVDVVTVNGTGCPRGTTDVVMSPDNTQFWVVFSDYIAQVNGGADATDVRKNCQIGIQVHVPQGFTYAVARADYVGYAYLAKGATATVQANYYFQGDASTTTTSTTLNGSYNKGWTASDSVAGPSLVYKPCGSDRILNVNTSLRVAAGSSGKATSWIAMDYAHGSARTLFSLSWKSC